MFKKVVYCIVLLFFILVFSSSILVSQKESKRINLFTPDEITKRDKADELLNMAGSLNITDIATKKRFILDAIMNAPNYYKPYIELGNLYNDEDPTVGRALYKLANKNYLKAWKLGKDDPELTDKDFFVILNSITNTYINLDKYKEAIEYLKFTVESAKRRDKKILLFGLEDPIRSSYDKMAWCYYKLDMIDKAIEMTEYAFEIDKTDPYARNILAACYAKLKKYKQAIEEYNKADKFTREDIFNNLGEVYLALFEYEKAEQNFLKVANSTKNYEYALTFCHLTDLYNNSLDIERTAEILDKFLSELNKASAKNDLGIIKLQLGKLYYYMGDYDKAMENLETALDFPQYFGNIGYTIKSYKFIIYFNMSLVALAKERIEAKKVKINLFEEIISWIKRIWLKIVAWWYKRLATLLLIVDLKGLDHLFIYDIGSILDYANIGYLLSSLDFDITEKKLHELLEKDERAKSKKFYYMYLAELYYNKGDNESIKKANDYIKKINPFEKNLEEKNKFIDTFEYNYKLNVLNLIYSMIQNYKANKKLLKKVADLPQEDNMKLLRANSLNRLLNRMFIMHSPSIRKNGYKLPVYFVSSVENTKSSFNFKQLIYYLKNSLSKSNFNLISYRTLNEGEFILPQSNLNNNKDIYIIPEYNVRYVIYVNTNNNNEGVSINITLMDITAGNIILAKETYNIHKFNMEKDIIDAVNSFAKNLFTIDTSG